MKLHGALFGCGMISEYHLRGWLCIPEVEIVALGNRTVQRAEERREQFAPRARVYSDLRAMVENEHLDFIDILTMPALHYEQCLMAKEAGLHIICQKPLCDNLADARRLVKALRGCGKLFAVHENHRYRAWFQTILSKWREGFFGNTPLVRIEHYNATEPREAYKNEAETGVWLEYGSHLVDMMRALLGEPTRVYARKHRLNPKVNGESLFHAAYEYPGATALIDAAWKTGAFTQGSVLVAGDEGEAYYEGTLTRGPVGRFRLSRGGEVVLDEARSPYDDYVDSFYLLEREFVDAVLGKGGIIQTPEENLRSMECTFAAYESATSGRIVTCGQR
jgi:predicted dehydrogenase